MVPKIVIKKQNKKIMNDLFKLLILEKRSNSIFYDLIQLFRFKIVEQVLKGTVTYSDHLRFVNNLWTIIIANSSMETRFTIQQIEPNQYVLTYDLTEHRKEILSKFVKYFRERCKEAKIKLKLNQEMEIALEKKYLI